MLVVKSLVWSMWSSHKEEMRSQSWRRVHLSISGSSFEPADRHKCDVWCFCQFCVKGTQRSKLVFRSSVCLWASNIQITFIKLYSRFLLRLPLHGWNLSPIDLKKDLKNLFFFTVFICCVYGPHCPPWCLVVLLRLLFTVTFYCFHVLIVTCFNVLITATVFWCCCLSWYWK